MAATYTNISKEDMEAFLVPQGFKALPLPGTTELVYGKRVDHEGLILSLRVYTGIWPSGESRAVGEDAIRINLFVRLPDGKIIKLGGSKRVHRVGGWKNNLQNRLNSWEENLPEHTCPKCGVPMVKRKGPYGDFFGCSNWPTCNQIRKVQ